MSVDRIDRRRRVELLLATRYDLLWFPKGSLKTTPGLAPGERRLCPDCGHTDHPGWLVDAFKRSRPCQTCGGVTEPKPRKGRGFVWVDGMDSYGTPVGDAETKASARPRRTVRCDACDGAGVIRGDRCRWCDGAGRRDLHAFELRLESEVDAAADPVDAAIMRRDQAGSYHELDIALARIVRTVNKPLPFYVLTVNAQQARRLLDDVYLMGREPLNLTMFERALVDLAVDYVVTLMPDPIRVPAGVLANAKILAEHKTRADARRAGKKAAEQRDREIVRLARRGKPAQWIAAEYGLHVSTVYAIVKAADERERVA